jgi:hypothetical protein
MELVVEDSNWRSKLKADFYIVKQFNAMSYYNVRLVKRLTKCKYVGVTHEYLDCEGVRGQCDFIKYRDHACGSSRKEKYTRDAKLLEEGLNTETNEGLITRYYFYLAQTYADMNPHPDNYSKAILNYRKRANRGGWSEEVFYSYYRIGLCLKSSQGQQLYPELLSLGSEGDMIKAFMDAYGVNPGRAEPIHELAHWYRHKEKYHSAYMFAKMACSIPYPEGNILFISNDVYNWKRFDELAVSAYWIGSYKESFDLCSFLLNSSDCPDHQKSRIEENKNFAAIKMKES